MGNIKLAHKLGLAFLLLILVMLVQALVSGRSMGDLEKNAIKQKQMYIAMVAGLKEMLADFSMARTSGSGSGTSSVNQAGDLLAEVKAGVAALRDLAGKYPELAGMEEGLQELADRVARYLSLSMARPGQADPALAGKLEKEAAAVIDQGDRLAD
ncbi:hypothetical protein [Desulfolithobacter sp.]